MNIVIITARAGSKSIKLKNLVKVNKKPILFYPINAALNSKKVDRVFVDTDGKSIKEFALKMGSEVINRSKSLSGDSINHGDVIYASAQKAKKICGDISNIVVLLGNTTMIDSKLIDKSLNILESNREIDSVMSVWEAGDDHPFRALEIDGKYLRPFKEVKNSRNASTERQSYKKAFFYDQGVWTFRFNNLTKKNGPRPWWWMGKKCLPIHRKWITGRDVNDAFDLPFHDLWAKKFY